MISHVQMSQFRAGLTFEQQVNLTVYILEFRYKDLLRHGVGKSILAGANQEFCVIVSVMYFS